jgi:hypothetical protein
MSRVQETALLLGVALVLTSSSPLYAASFRVGLDGDAPLPATRIDAVTGLHAINIYLDFGDPDVASIFEGTFAVEVAGGGGTTATLLAPSSSDWNAGCFAGATTVSCTSDNAGGSRLVGNYSVDIAPGDYLAIRWVTGFAAMDINDPPYTLDIPITTPEGTTLFATPEPGTALLLAAGLSWLNVKRTRKRI